MTTDVSLPKTLDMDRMTLIKLGLAISYSTPFYRNITPFEVANDLYARVRVNKTLNYTATLAEILAPDFQKTEQEVPLFRPLGQQPAYLISTVLKEFFDTLPHENRHAMLMIPAVILPILSTISVILRFFTRCFITKMVRLEDWLIIPALNIVIRQHFVTFCHFFIKASLLALYYRLSPKPSFRIAVLVTAVINFLHTLSNFLLVLLACTPLQWPKAMYTYKCKINQITLNLAGVSIFMLLDIIIVLLPVPIVWRLQLRTSEKVLTLGLFGLGILVCIASGIKLARLPALVYDVDTTWEIDNFQWTLIELNLGIICACAPAFRHLTSRPRLKRFYQERFQGKRIFYPQNPTQPLTQLELRKIPGVNRSEPMGSSLALQVSNATSAAATDSKAGSGSSSAAAYLHPNQNRGGGGRQGMKILSKDDLDLIERGLVGMDFIDACGEFEGDGGDVERESIYTHDLTRASSRALPDDSELDGGFEIVKGSGVNIR
ncbi:hypothetical protein H072_606 [Dactylellina haptotyla CBS 200.50]|uniref:Rhodopsin domain-containing protein n=1 Tax=Dactylellina haptotyla (strain CBS 200.50) TaxID=1284197 RepID=S8CCM2_DACHA|nr:hypothetical protein H072_606 [Dactylellina haptotyla CBS 200.50]